MNLANSPCRIREVEQAPDGSIWLLEDTPGGRLLRLAPPG
ncbi:PQQ-dependent sugar dehydrogenase [Propionicimonas sp.]|nr:PQQ-dependent sugar dehydrogenase [Propionicimonas sp.]MCG2805358.1 PQQ-dependent sugar dehydrogenase [Propionicimonas sp.]